MSRPAAHDCTLEAVQRGLSLSIAAVGERFGVQPMSLVQDVEVQICQHRHHGLYTPALCRLTRSLAALEEDGGVGVGVGVGDTHSLPEWTEAVTAEAAYRLEQDGVRCTLTAVPERGFINIHCAAADAGTDADTDASGDDAAGGTNEPHHVDTTYEMRPIGILESCFKEKHGTPRQGALVPTSRARLSLRVDIPEVSLDGLGGFSHVWLVFLFHRDVGLVQGRSLVDAAAVKGKVKPPRLRGCKVGVFASRTPHRPNPIGLSLCRLERVEGRTLHLSGVDLIEGTPILDIKPYHPEDQAPAACVCVPEWMEQTPHVGLERVTLSREAETRIRECCEQGVLQFYSHEDAEALRETIVQTLRLDPRTLHSKTKHADGSIYGIMIDRLDVVFEVIHGRDGDDDRCHVFRIDFWAPGETRPKLRTREWLKSVT